VLQYDYIHYKLILFNIVLCYIVRHIVDSDKTSNLIKNKSNVVIRLDSKEDNVVVLVYLPIITSKLYFTKFVNCSGLILLFREEESIISIRILIIVASIFIHLMLRSNIVRISI